jgi:hypothetical protein
MSHASRRLRLLALLAVCAACGSAAPPLACAAEPGAVDELGRALLAEARADDAVAYVTRLRRTLHASPEVKWQERETAGIVERALQELGLPYTSGVAGTGVVATLGSGEPVVALRADMDALLVDGRLLHACGHDAHMAMLLGAARLLKARQLPAGTVKLVFQPAEEGGAGAAAMVEGRRCCWRERHVCAPRHAVRGAADRNARLQSRHHHGRVCCLACALRGPRRSCCSAAQKRGPRGCCCSCDLSPANTGQPRNVRLGFSSHLCHFPLCRRRRRLQRGAVAC